MMKLTDHEGVENNGYKKTKKSTMSSRSAHIIALEKNNERCYNCFRRV